MSDNRISNHKDLDVWKLSMELVTAIYEMTGNFPREEIYGLTNQMRRAAVSIPSNIAEGAARNSEKEFLQFLHFSLGSVAELETQLLISDNLEFSTNATALHQKVARIKRMLIGLIAYLKGGEGP